MMKTMKLLLSITILLTVACKRDKSIPPTETPKKLYLLSEEEVGTSSKYAGKYSVDGVTTTFINGISQDARVIDMAVENNDIYVLSKRRNVNTSNEDYIVLKNNVVVNVLPDNGSLYPACLYVNGADIYIGGFGTNVAGTTDVAKLWKNGVLTIVSGGTQEAACNAVYVVGTDVYCAGYERGTSGALIAAYWKNGVKTQLGLGNNSVSTEVNDMVVINNDVYTVGVTGFNKPLYWKNTTATQLATANGEAYCVKVIGTDVFVGGYMQNASGYQATYWKNGTATFLTNASNDAVINDMAVNNNDVYAVGYNSLNGSIYPASYWKNGVETIMSANGSNAEIKRIIIK
jgi:hypothetical protein